MIFIWGSRNRQDVVTGGRFPCPTCRREKDYALIQVSRYFTVYWIPLFRTSILGHYVQCQSCGGTYAEEILQEQHYVAEVVEDAGAATWVCGRCQNLNPSGYSTCIKCQSARV